MSANVIVVLLAMAAILAAEGVFYAIGYAGHQRRAELLRRLRGVAEAERDVSLLRERRLARSPVIARVLDGLAFARQLEQLLLKTDLSMTVASLLTLGAMASLGLSLVLLLISPHRPLLAALGPPIGLAIPILYVAGVRDRRSRKLSEQLPEALDMMVRSLRAGHSVGAGFKLVATELSPPVAVEFARCFEEQNAGVSLRESVGHMTERMPKNMDLKIFAVSLVVQHETGGNLVEILDQIGATIRARYQFFGKLRSLTAEARLSGIILSVLPFLAFSLIFLFRPVYLQPLLHDTLGILIFAVGGVLWILGGLWMRKLSQVDY